MTSAVVPRRSAQDDGRHDYRTTSTLVVVLAFPARIIAR